MDGFPTPPKTSYKSSNQKLLEVQEPFLEKVPGRRRQIRRWILAHPVPPSGFFSYNKLEKFPLLLLDYFLQNPETLENPIFQKYGTGYAIYLPGGTT